MARIFMAGNELNDYTIEFPTLISGSHIASGNQPGGRRTGQGNQGRFYFYNYSNASYPTVLQSLLPVTVSEVWGRFAYHENGSAIGGTHGLFGFVNTAAGTPVVARLVKNWTGSAYTFSIQNGAGSALATSSFSTSYADGQWHLIEFRILMAGSGGRFEMWFDNTKILDYTGALVGAGSETTFNAIRMGNFIAPTNNLVQSFDDIALNDTSGTINNGRIGDGTIIALYPNGVGANSQLTNAFNNSTRNFEHVNRHREYALGTDPTGFVGTATPGQKDTYHFEDVPPEYGAVNAIKFVALANRNGPAIGNIRFRAIPPSQSEVAFPTAPGVALPNGALNWVQHIQEVNPNTSNPFTVPEVNGAEFGFSLEA
jgi:hypothetical protein